MKYKSRKKIDILKKITDRLDPFRFYNDMMTRNSYGGIVERSAKQRVGKKAHKSMTEKMYSLHKKINDRIENID